MKRPLIIALLLQCFFWTSQAQTKLEKERLVHDTETVTISFDINSTKGVPLRYKEVIMPYIYSGNDTLWFETIEVYGRGRYMRQMQEEYQKGNKLWNLSKSRVLAGGIAHYEASVPVKPWMKSATLGIYRHLVGCLCDMKYEDLILKEGLSLYQEPQKQETPEEPEVRVPRYLLADVQPSWDFGEEDLLVKFNVDEDRLDPYLFENYRTFRQILSAVDKIYSNSRYRLAHIDIAGYASPDGITQKNIALAQRRADALIDYIIASRPQYNLTRKDFHIHNGEVNWEGLRQYLDHSNIEEKDWIKVVIGSNMPDERKKSILMSIDGGRLWRKLLDEVFPHLRSARFLGVYYGSTNNDNAANEINQANDMIRNGDYVDAYNHLLHLQDDIRAYNTIGVSLMMQGMYDEAMEWFEMAVENGFPMAAKNINSINSQRESAQKEMMLEYLKQYE